MRAHGSNHRILRRLSRLHINSIPNSNKTHTHKCIEIKEKKKGQATKGCQEHFLLM